MQKQLRHFQRLRAHLLFLRFGHLAVRLGGKSASRAEAVGTGGLYEKVHGQQNPLLGALCLDAFCAGAQRDGVVLFLHGKVYAGDVVGKQRKALRFPLCKHSYQLVLAEYRHLVAGEIALLRPVLLRRLPRILLRRLKLHVVQKAGFVQLLLTARKGKHIAYRQSHVLGLTFKPVGDGHGRSRGRCAAVEQLFGGALAAAHHRAALEAVGAHKIFRHGSEIVFDKFLSQHQHHALSQGGFLAAFFRYRLQRLRHGSAVCGNGFGKGAHLLAAVAGAYHLGGDTHPVCAAVHPQSQHYAPFQHVVALVVYRKNYHRGGYQNEEGYTFKTCHIAPLAADIFCSPPLQAAA